MVEMIKNILSTLLNTAIQVKNLGIPKSIDEAIAFVKAVFFDIIAPMNVAYILAFAICAAVVAFAGFKLYKMGLYAGGAVVFALLVNHFSDKILPLVEGKIPGNINVLAVLMAAAALVAILITRFKRKLMVCLIGADMGYLIGSTFVAGKVVGFFPTLTFLQHPIVNTIVGVLCGIVAMMIFRLVFEHLVLIGSAIGGMACCGLLLGLAIMPGADKQTLLMFIAVGAVVGILGIVHQYNEEAKTNDVFYSYKL